MDGRTIVHAWKDTMFRESLTPDQREQIPDDPAGAIVLGETELREIAGANTEHLLTIGCCDGFTDDPGYCSLGCGSEDCTVCEELTGCLCLSACGPPGT